MKRIFTSHDSMIDVFEDNQGGLYLVALCAGIAWTRIGIVLNESEVKDFRVRPESVQEIARQMCFDFTPFRSRAVPEDVQRTIIAVDER
jgi:hypothetical protein